MTTFYRRRGKRQFDLALTVWTVVWMDTHFAVLP